MDNKLFVQRKELAEKMVEITKSTRDTAYEEAIRDPRRPFNQSITNLIMIPLLKIIGEADSFRQKVSKKPRGTFGGRLNDGELVKDIEELKRKIEVMSYIKENIAETVKFISEKKDENALKVLGKLIELVPSKEIFWLTRKGS